jgi:hypothetical protein
MQCANFQHRGSTKISQYSFTVFLFICSISHTSHGVALYGVAGNVIKPQKQTAKEPLHTLLQFPLPSSVGEVAYTGRRWNNHLITQSYHDSNNNHSCQKKLTYASFSS